MIENFRIRLVRKQKRSTPKHWPNNSVQNKKEKFFLDCSQLWYAHGNTGKMQSIVK